MRKFTGFRFLVTIAGTALEAPSYAGTCALCRQALAAGGSAGLIRGMYWSILLMAGVPLLLMAAVGWLVWRQRRLRRIAPPQFCPGCKVHP